MTPEQDLQYRVDLLEEECLQLKNELQRQRLDTYQLIKRIEKCEKQSKSEDESSKNSWEQSGLL
jgi:hypothetical protein